VVSEESFHGNNTFFLARSNNKAERKEKKPFPREPKEIDFTPINNDEEWKDELLSEQVKTTVSSIQHKTLRAPDEVFYVIHPKVAPSYSDIGVILDRLKAEIFGLDSESYPIYEDREELNKSFEKVSKQILNLNPKDVKKYISKQTLWNTKNNIRENHLYRISTEIKIRCLECLEII
jgi:hypothetical protein